MIAPVKPFSPGTHHLGSGMAVTIGREHVVPALHAIIQDRSVAVDIETYGLGLLGRDIKIVTIAHETEAVVLDVRDPAQHGWVKEAISQVDRMILHNSPYDMTNLAINELASPKDAWKVVDTLIWARLAEPSMIVRKSLEDCVQRYLGVTKAGTSMNRMFRELGLTIKEGWKRFDVDRPVYVYGAALDAIMTARLEKPIKKAAYQTLTQNHPWAGKSPSVSGQEAWDLLERDQIVNRRFLQRSMQGLRIDPDWADVYADSHRPEREAALKVVRDAGVKPGDGKSLINFLDEQHAIPPVYPRTPKTGQWSTNKNNLERLHHPVAEAFVRAREIDHVQKDYLQKCLELEHNGRVYPQVNVLAAVTGRASMGDPPLQQFPGDARGIILADPGEQITSIDWSQIEPVLAANMAKQHDMLIGYETGTMDFYQTIASAAGIPRKHAKVVLLAQIYGEGIRKLSLDLGMPVEEAKALKDEVFRPIPKIAKLMETVKSLANRHRKMFTVSGRILPIPVKRDEETGAWAVLAYIGVNYLIQGSAYDVLADTIVRVEQAGLGDAVYLMMHDELIVETSAAHDVRKIMTEPPTALERIARRTPVLRTDLLDLGERWAEA